MLQEDTNLPTKDHRQDDHIVELVEILASIDTSSALATLNSTSISDNNGRRIQL